MTATLDGAEAFREVTEAPNGLLSIDESGKFPSEAERSEHPADGSQGKGAADTGADAGHARALDAAARRERALRAANARLEDFVCVAAHDLRAPLRGIGDLAEWLREELRDASPEALRNLSRMQRRVQLLEGMIEELLAYARARDPAGMHIPIRPEELLASVIELVAPPAGFTISQQLAAQPFEAVRAPLETVLRNLLGNAIRHHDRAHGHIQIRMIDEGPYCHIELRDDGPGLPSAARARVLERIENAASAERGGSGLGLALTKRLVEAHEGKLALVSRDGERGTTFHVWWPRERRSRP